jgi:hypothetical protein
MQARSKLRKHKLYGYIHLQGSLLAGMCRVYIHTHTHTHLPAMKTNMAVVLNWYYLKVPTTHIRVQGWYCLMSYPSGRCTSPYTNVSTLCPARPLPHTHRPLVHTSVIGRFLEYEEWWTHYGSKLVFQMQDQSKIFKNCTVIPQLGEKSGNRAGGNNNKQQQPVMLCSELT